MKSSAISTYLFPDSLIPKERNHKYHKNKDWN